MRDIRNINVKHKGNRNYIKNKILNEIYKIQA